MRVPSLDFGEAFGGCASRWAAERLRLLYTHARLFLSHSIGRFITRFTWFTRFAPTCLWFQSES